MGFEGRGGGSLRRDDEVAVVTHLNPNPDAAPPATQAWLESMMPCTNSIALVDKGRAILSTDKM
jgi:hypothetical protein